jgi:hypothetical protein
MITSDLEQKQSLEFSDGTKFFLVPRRHEYEQNGRETNPVIGKILMVGEGVENVLVGDLVALHHNIIFDNSLGLDIEGTNRVSVIKFDRWVMAKIDSDGELIPINQNTIAERIVKHKHDTYESKITYYDDRVRVISSDNGFTKGDIIGMYKYSDYEVVYNWKGDSKRRIVIKEDDITIKLN